MRQAHADWSVAMQEFGLSILRLRGLGWSLDLMRQAHVDAGVAIHGLRVSSLGCRGSGPDATGAHRFGRRHTAASRPARPDPVLTHDRPFVFRVCARVRDLQS